jgi:hypothetical protein
MGDKKIECLVCGRIFYEGQGVKISIGGQELVFHSKSCALKFFKNLILYLDQKSLESTVKMVVKELKDRIDEIKEKRKKQLESL